MERLAKRQLGCVTKPAERSLDGTGSSNIEMFVANPVALTDTAMPSVEAAGLNLDMVNLDLVNKEPWEVSTGYPV